MARFAALLIASLVLGVTACSSNSDNKASVSGAGPVQVATGISVLGDRVRQVGGGCVTVISLIPPGQTHTPFSPRPRT